MGCVVTNKYDFDIFITTRIHIDGDLVGTSLGSSVIVPRNMSLGVIPDNVKIVLVGMSLGSTAGGGPVGEHATTQRNVSGDTMSIQLDLPTSNLTTNVERLVLLNGGSGYNVSRSGAALIANATTLVGTLAGTYDSDAAGVVTAVNLTDGGSGYDYLNNVPSFTLTGGTGLDIGFELQGGVEVLLTTVEV